MQQIPYNVPPLPANRVQSPVVLERNTLRADPKKVAGERQSRTVWGGLAGAGFGALIGLTLNRRNANGAGAIVAGTALGGALGVALGQFGKTTEESYSEILTNAADSKDFVGHVKREMKQREDMAFLEGAIIGFPYFW
ncbi:MAG: hypothetical protein ACKVOE_05535 [Rickettsiales bacterium]